MRFVGWVEQCVGVALRNALTQHTQIHAADSSISTPLTDEAWQLVN